MVSLQDRFRGLMVGGLVGDCLGRPFEGARIVPDHLIDEVVGRGYRMPYSDDTVLAIALTESLLARGGFDGAGMANRFVEAWSDQPERGYGSNVVLLFGSVKRGANWKQAAESQFSGAGSYGNGGAMRVAPVALWGYPDLAETIELAIETARVTHTHPVGVEGAVIQAVAAHHALFDDFDGDALLSQLRGLIETDQFTERMATLEKCLSRDDDERARLHLGNWVAADRSVLTALYAFLLGDGFEDTIRRAIRLGGDTDTIAAMAGALAGARYGLTSIPDSWLNVEDFPEVVELANRLYERVA